MVNTKGVWDDDGFVSTYDCMTCDEIVRSMSYEDLQNYSDGFHPGWVFDEFHGLGFGTPEQILEAIKTNVWPEIEPEESSFPNY